MPAIMSPQSSLPFGIVVLLGAVRSVSPFAGETTSVHRSLPAHVSRPPLRPKPSCPLRYDGTSAPSAFVMRSSPEEDQGSEENALRKHENNWLVRFQQLQEYKDRFGNCNVPRGWEENPQLATWINTQRTQYRKLQDGKESQMTEERIEKLNAIGFICYAQDAAWELRYEQLQVYKGRFGNCNVPGKWEENPQLATWINTQRTQYRKLQDGKESQMTEERIEKLNAIGFICYAQDAAWELRYEQLLEYKDRFGNCNVPRGWEENPQLGSWVHNQRTQYRMLQKGKEPMMTEKRIEKLNAIGFTWDPLDAAWEFRYEQLQDYKNRFVNCNVPAKWKEDPKFGKWVMNQRAEYRKLEEGKESSITEERIEKLNAVDFTWSLRRRIDVPWELRYEQLQEYKDRFGNCNVPAKWEEHPQLGTWVHNQRAEYRKLQEGKESSMTEERIETLNSIGFSWDANDAAWELRYEQLQEYKDRFGHCNVPIKWEENPQLGKWVHNQRAEYRKLQEGKESSMTEERIETLNSIGFSWDANDAAWELRYEQLQEYKDRFGHCNVPIKWEENPQLGKWVNTQRTQYRKHQEGKQSQMTEERVERLNSIGFVWSLRRKRKI